MVYLLLSVAMDGYNICLLLLRVWMVISRTAKERSKDFVGGGIVPP